MTDDFVNLEYAHKLHDTKNTKNSFIKKLDGINEIQKLNSSNSEKNIEFPRSNSLDIICS